MRARTLTAAGLLAAAALAVTACSSAGTAATFTPGGGGPSAAGGPATDAAAGSGGYVMPPFGTNVHVDMTSWLPANAAQAQAVNTDKDYELAYLYAEYKGGQDQTWVNYVSSVMHTAVQQSLQATDVTTESFTGTVKYFDMSVIPDPLVKGDLDVSACFDNAGSSNTDLTTGKVIRDTSSPDTHYVRIADELRKDSAGQWQVVSSLPAIYYPQAAQCKP
ncbi:MAG TPA: hypothetical protein VH021_06700 [Trebonia sp.]|jgi:hypothetical protein|nr:hypothetical protein [Trebonia sp.]